MNGVHDMGGMHGFGKVEPEPNEPVFHAPWEGRVLALHARDGLRRRVEHRHVALRAGDACRRRSISASPTTSAGRWRMEKNLLERGLVGADELAAGHALRPAQAAAAQADGGRRRRSADARHVRRATPTAPARFKIGDRVRAKNIHPATHTRLAALCARPRRRRRALHGCHVFPDTRRARPGRRPAMALHGACSTAASCGGRTPTRP